MGNVKNIVILKITNLSFKDLYFYPKVENINNIDFPKNGFFIPRIPKPGHPGNVLILDFKSIGCSINLEDYYFKFGGEKRNRTYKSIMKRSDIFIEFINE